MHETSVWQLSDQHRSATVRRTAENLFVLAFSRDEVLSDKDALQKAEEFESTAYTVARIESQTTSGSRPAAECVKAYVRKLTALMLEFLDQGKASKLDDSGHDALKQDEPMHNDEDNTTFVLTGAREFMTNESAQKQLAPLLSDHVGVKRMKLSTKSFGTKPDNSAEVVVSALEAQQESLTDVDFSDVIAGRPEAEALATLKVLCDAAAKLKLQRLDLSDNALGEKGLRACSAAIQNQEDLQFLGLRNVGCSINACRALRELLNKTSNLQSIHLYNNMSGDEGAAAIADILARAPKMSDFKMVSSRVGAEGGIAIAKGLRAGNELERLELSDNPMTSEVAKELAATIRVQPKLKALILNDISLCGDECPDGLQEICLALADSAPKLEELELALNEITPDCAEALAKVLVRKPYLKRVVLRENELENEGALLIAMGLKHLDSLQHVDLTQNQIKSSGSVAIAKSLAASKASLKSLELDENEISEQGVQKLKACLEQLGLSDALGSLEENDASNDDDEDEEDGSESDLVEAFANTRIE